MAYDFPSGLISALGGRRKSLYESEPAYTSGLALGNTDIPLRAGKGFWANFWPKATAGLLSGISTGYGKSVADDKYRSEYDELSKVLGAPEADRPSLLEAMSDDAQSAYAPLFEAKELQDQIAEEAHQKSLERIRENRNAAIEAYGGRLSDEDKAAMVDQTISDLGLDPSARPQLLQSIQGAQTFKQAQEGLGEVRRRIGQKASLGGEKIRAPNSGELQRLQAAQEFQIKARGLTDLARKQQFADDTWLGRVGAGLTRAAKAGDIPIVGPLTAQPESPEYLYNSRLSEAQQGFARGRETGALTLIDVAQYDPLFKGVAIADSQKAMLDRMKFLEESSLRGYANTIDTLRKGKVNVDEFFDEDIYRRGKKLLDEANRVELQKEIAPDQQLQVGQPSGQVTSMAEVIQKYGDKAPLAVQRLRAMGWEIRE